MMRSELKHVVADSRTSQELEPLRVPVKLQDRSGFLFTSAATPSRESAKKHLPDVILRNKMMAFESKWQCTNKSSLLYDPLDASFERLSMEEREEVMNRIQTRVERITDAVEDKYRRKKQQLDDQVRRGCIFYLQAAFTTGYMIVQGVFDPAINTRRVQAMYLVDLQRQCNLDLLKTQVLQEFDQERQPLFAGSFGQKPSSATAPVHVLGTLLQDAEPPIQELRGSKKLQRLLRSHSMAKSTSEPLLERRKSVRSGSITVATPSNNTPSNTGASHTAAADVATPPVASSNNPPPPGRASQSDNDPRHVAMARHPEIVSVVASLRATDAVAKLLKKRSKTAFRPGQDMAAKPDNAVDEWKVWLRLGMPYHLKLNMLEKYASHDGAGALHTAIDLWEAATDMVVLREALVVVRILGIITLNRPKQLNALCDGLINELNAEAKNFDKDPNISAIIEMATREFIEVYNTTMFANWGDIAKIQKPVIAAVNGFALGGGCELAMLCDMIIAGDTAKFGQPEIKLGTIPGCGGTQRLIRAIGKSKAMHLILTGDLIDAHQAERDGLVAKVVPADNLLDEALAVANKIATYSQPITRMAKEAVNASYEMSLQESVKYEARLFYGSFATHDQKEGMAAFVEKRKPNFKNE
ncbi:hypothetical protein B5M09_007488 [Aphanomyces astaci]|uniref:Enoyl-CoA hydratase n=1 Tax=Aphanomyces astaci TaxID=112090 RepID=A0A3R7YFQ3_APHAT|nr:hypothetical protein B5M09_007488 [Aphanomyces astaci]